MSTASETKLYNNKKEQAMYDGFVELYAIIKTAKKLEKAYVRDLVSSSTYETECHKLIAQFRIISSILNDFVPSVEHFAIAYKMDCPTALSCLLVSGIPAIVEHHAAN